MGGTAASDESRTKRPAGGWAVAGAAEQPTVRAGAIEPERGEA